MFSFTVSVRSFFPKETLPSQYSGVYASYGFLNWSDRFDTSYWSSSKLWRVWWLSLDCCFFSYSLLQFSGWICLVENLNSLTLKESLSTPEAILTTSYGRWSLCFRYVACISKQWFSSVSTCLTHWAYFNEIRQVANNQVFLGLWTILTCSSATGFYEHWQLISPNIQEYTTCQMGHTFRGKLSFVPTTYHSQT